VLYFADVAGQSVYCLSARGDTCTGVATVLTDKAVIINLFGGGVGCSGLFLPFLFCSLSPASRNDPSNLAKTFGKALLSSARWGERHLQLPDTFSGL